MFLQKNNIFLDLSKNQKSSLISYLRNFSKKNNESSIDDILDLFVEEELYYFNVGNPHFEWILPFFDKESFLKEIKAVLKHYKFEMELKEKQRPYIEKQKEFIKKERKRQQEIKQSRESPTTKQLKYYKKLCSKYSLPVEDLTVLSKLDLKNMIAKIIADHEKDVFKCLESN